MENNKKDILFIQGGIGISGISKALVNFLTALDPQKYNVDLFLIDYEGVLRPYLPDYINVIEKNSARLVSLGFSGLKPLLFKFRFDLFIISLIRLFCSWINRPLGAWIFSRILPSINKEYDVIVDWQGQQQLYYLVDRLNGKKKISFFHSDYKKWPYYYSFDKRYFPKVDKICTISEQCVQSLKDLFPAVEDKIELVPNLSLPRIIYKMSEAPINTDSYHGYVFLTLGHVSYNKGIDLVIDAAQKLFEKGIDFTWLFVGSTNGANEYIKTIHRSPMKDNFFFLGIQANPYPFMKIADYYIHPSRFEGKSVALDEAKIMCKPVIVTNFSTVHDQFEDGYNASICEMSGDSLFTAIFDIINDDKKKNLYVSNLLNELEINPKIEFIDELL